jgi:hypothetical protein
MEHSVLFQASIAPATFPAAQDTARVGTFPYFTLQATNKSMSIRDRIFLHVYGVLCFVRVFYVVYKLISSLFFVRFI